MFTSPLAHNRIIGLDILRSLAILIVVYMHGIYLLPNKFHDTYDACRIIKIDGVSLFFVLSGFLIGRILLQTLAQKGFDRKNLFQFWLRRWYRTLPNYFLILFLILWFDTFIVHQDTALDYRYIFFLQNFKLPHPGFFPEAWSLSIEEWFYLLFPFLLYVLHRIFNNKTKSLIVSIAFFVIMPLLLRMLLYKDNQLQPAAFDEVYRKVVIYRLDSLMYGVIAATIYYYQPVLWKKMQYKLLPIGALILILFYFNPLNFKFFYYPILFNIESLCVCCFLPFLSMIRSTKIVILDKLIVLISTLSYAMYLINLSLVQLRIMPQLNILLKTDKLPIEDTYWFNYPIYWLLTIMLAFAIYFFYERKMTALRDRF